MLSKIGEVLAKARFYHTSTYNGILTEHKRAVEALIKGVFYYKVPNQTDMVFICNLERNKAILEIEGISFKELFDLGLSTKYKNDKYRDNIAKCFALVQNIDD